MHDSQSPNRGGSSPIIRGRGPLVGHGFTDLGGGRFGFADGGGGRSKQKAGADVSGGRQGETERESPLPEGLGDRHPLPVATPAQHMRLSTLPVATPAPHLRLSSNSTVAHPFQNGSALHPTNDSKEAASGDSGALDRDQAAPQVDGATNAANVSSEHATVIGTPSSSSVPWQWQCSELARLNLTSGDSTPGAMYLGALSTWLDSTPYQGLIAGVAVLIGLLCIWDGAFVWRALFTAISAAAAAAFVRFEAGGHELTADTPSEILLMVQAAAAMALATHTGFEGFQVLLGAHVGFLGAYGCGSWARYAGQRVPGFALMWYAAGAAGGILLATLWRRPVLAALAPLLGGFLLASGTGILVSRGCAAWAESESNATSLSGVVDLLPPPDTPWVSAATTLLGPGGLTPLAWHGGCALAALLLHGCKGERRIVAVACLIGCVAGTALTAAAGGATCEKDDDNCLVWIASGADAEAPRRWPWQVSGCIFWAILTAASAYRQLGMHTGWKARDYWEASLNNNQLPLHKYAQLPPAPLPRPMHDPPDNLVRAGSDPFLGGARGAPDDNGRCVAAVPNGSRPPPPPTTSLTAWLASRGSVTGMATEQQRM